jgi:hypothetical protein
VDTNCQAPAIAKEVFKFQAAAGTSSGMMSKSGGSILLAPADLAAASPQITPLRLIPPQEKKATQVIAGASNKASRLSLYDQRRQPETGAILPGLEVDSRIPYQTPREVMEIDWLLNGQAVVENQAEWMQGHIQSVIWMWTAPYQPPVTIQLTRQVVSLVSLQPRLQVEDGCASTPAWRPLPRICDTPCDAPLDMAASDQQAGGTDAGMWGGGARGDMDVAQVMTVQAALTPSMCLEGRPPPPLPQTDRADDCMSRDAGGDVGNGVRSG